MFRLPSQDERAHVGTVELGREPCEVIIIGTGQQRPGVLLMIDARRLDVDLIEAGPAEAVAILRFRQGAGHAAGPELDAAPNGLRHVAPPHDVGHREASTQLEHTEHLGQHLRLEHSAVHDTDHAALLEHVLPGRIRWILNQSDRLHESRHEDRRLQLRLCSRRPRKSAHHHNNTDSPEGRH